MKLAILAIGLYPVVNRWGMNGAAGLVAIAGCITGAGALWAAFSYLGGGRTQVVQSMGFPALNTAVMAVAVMGTRALLFDGYDVVSFVVLSLVGMVAYLLMVALTAKLTPYTAPSALIDRIRKAAS